MSGGSDLMDRIADAMSASEVTIEPEMVALEPIMQDRGMSH